MRSDLPAAPVVTRPCLECGELTGGSRCDECRRERAREVARETYARDGRRERLPGHEDASWRRLSRKARRIQPWCTDCRRTVDELQAHELLTADHLPSAWYKREHSLPLSLSDVEVCCSTCNIARGSSRPGSERYAAWQQHDATA